MHRARRCRLLWYVACNAGLLITHRDARFALNARRPLGEANRSANLQEDVETILQLMGLTQAAPVRVGSDRIRGVSGGQRRRVSLAEALATRARYVGLIQDSVL
jgi:ABC-type glutathione transport system ATPase component